MGNAFSVKDTQHDGIYPAALAVVPAPFIFFQFCAKMSNALRTWLGRPAATL